MRSRISIRGCVRPSVRRSVCRSVRPSVRPSVGHTRVEFLIFRLKWNKIALRTWCYATWRSLMLKLNKRASITWNYHFRDHLNTSTRADRQNASYVWTPSDLFMVLRVFMVYIHVKYLKSANYRIAEVATADYFHWYVCMTFLCSGYPLRSLLPVNERA